jgi:hypothetical protein
VSSISENVLPSTAGISLAHAACAAIVLLLVFRQPMLFNSQYQACLLFLEKL